MTVIGVFILAGFVISGYFAFFHGQSGQIKLRHLDKNVYQGWAKKFNEFVKRHPELDLDKLTQDLNWIIKNDYHRDLRVKRIVHQDLESLGRMSKLRSLISDLRPADQARVDESLKVITQRAHDLRHIKEEHIREEMLLLGGMIERNSR
jgi:hypothetical protein